MRAMRRVAWFICDLILKVACGVLAVLPVYLIVGASRNSPRYIFVITGLLLGLKIWHWPGGSDVFRLKRLFGLEPWD
jgi:hypothetical protein